MTISPPDDWIVPDWPAPPRVRAIFTTRAGGVSVSPYDTFNLGLHTGDDPAAVAANRERLQAVTGARPCWLEQVHGSEVVSAELGVNRDTPLRADASVTTVPGIACTVMVADCLPVLLCDAQGHAVGAAHAGWRGLCGGVIEQAVRALRARAGHEGHEGEVLAWLGPAIGPSRFEVGAEVREAFTGAALPGEADATREAFAALPQPGKYLADLYALARLRLAREGVTQVWGAQWCTVASPARFYSYRRDRATGRMAALIWLDQSR